MTPDAPRGLTPGRLTGRRTPPDDGLQALPDAGRRLTPAAGAGVVGAARIAAVAWVAAVAGACGAGPVRVERTVYLMGTTARFVAEAADRAAGRAQLERMVRVVEATEAELSTWRAASVLSGVNRQPVGEARAAPAAICDLLGRAEAWQAATGGAFDPAVGRLIDAWDLRGGGRQPDPAARAGARARSGFEHLQIDRAGVAGVAGAAGAGAGSDAAAGADPSRSERAPAPATQIDRAGGRPGDADGPAPCAITRRADVTLDAGAFGKGEALRRVAAAERGRPGAWLIDFGGQVAVSGPAAAGAWAVALAHPAERATPVVELRLAAGSLASTGGSERDVTVDGVRIGHVVDPRAGRPISRRAAVTVWHADPFAADVLSTALYVMGVEAGLAWADARGLAAVFLVPTDAAADDGPANAAAPVRRRPTPAFARRFALPAE